MQRKITRLTHAFVAIVITFLTIPIDRAFAAGNTLYFNPNSQSVSLNGSFTISVKAYVETAAQTGRVSGTVSYPKSLLRVTATSTTGSSYGNPAITQDANAGTIGFSGTINPGPSGISQVFSITFQGIGAGTANLSFSGDSTINQTTTTRNTAAYTVVDPNPAPTPTPPKPTPPTPTKPTTPVVTVPTPTPEPVSTPPDSSTIKDNTTVDESGVITDVSSSSTYDTATINWKLSKEQASTQLIYGVSKSVIASKTETTKEPDGGYKTILKGLKPGVKYYFTVLSEGKDGKKNSYDSVVVTKGYPVVLAITQNDQPSPSANIRIGTINRSTDKDGTASFDLAEGTYSATITAQDNTTLTTTFSVASKVVPSDGKAPDSQRFSFNLQATSAEGGGNQTSVFIFIATLVGGGALIVLGAIGFIAYRRRQFEGSYSAGGEATSISMAPTVIVDDGYNWQQAAPLGPQPPPPPQPLQPYSEVAPGGYEEPKDMFEIAREREEFEAAPDNTPPKPPQMPPPSFPPTSY